MKTPTDSDRTFDRALTDSRATAGELGNHAIDEFKAGRLTRRELLRHASVLGVTLAVGGVGSLAGITRARAQGAAKPGGTIRVAHLTPVGAVDPLTVTDAAGLALINQTGEFLIDDDGEKLVLRAGARAVVEVERQGRRVDLQAAPEREIPRRPEDRPQRMSPRPSTGSPIPAADRRRCRC